MAEHKGTIKCWAANGPIIGGGRVVGEEGKKTHVFHPGAAFNRGCGGCWSVQLLFGDERCTLKMHTMYVCCVCAGWRRQRCFIVPPPPPPPPRSASASPSQQVRGEYAGGKKKNPFFFSFHQQFMMERCSTYSPHQPQLHPQRGGSTA